MTERPPFLDHSSKSHIALTILLLLAMAVSTFTSHALGILASFLIDEFSITRAELGTVIAVSSILGAVVAIPSGRGVDLIGAKNALLVVMAASALVFFLYALANNIVIMYVASAIASIPLASANPATNKTIALHLPSGRRGTVTGVKQSGVAIGLWVGGVMLPVAALSLGWRAAMAIVGAATVIALVVTAVVVPQEPSDTGRRSAPTRILPSAPTGNLLLDADLAALTVFAFLLGFATSALAFMPLYAQEILGLSPVLSGVAVAMVGFAGVAGRVVWARLADRHLHFERILQWLALGGAVSFGLILTAPYGVGPWQLGIGALLMGFTATSWNSVGMLAVITRSEFSRAGRESGVLMFGFMLGLGIGPPIQGWSVDLTGRYDILWSLSLGLALIGFAVMASRSRRR